MGRCADTRAYRPRFLLEDVLPISPSVAKVCVFDHPRCWRIRDLLLREGELENAAPAYGLILERHLKTGGMARMLTQTAEAGHGSRCSAAGSNSTGCPTARRPRRVTVP